MPRGGKRPGAGRPRKPVEQHLAEGTYRPARHRHLLARPLPLRRRPRLTAFQQRLQLLESNHWRLSDQQLALARDGPAWVYFDHADTPEVQAAAAVWQAWDERYGLDWRLQNECPTQEDERRLGKRLGHYVDSDDLLAGVENAVASWDASLPNPPGWDELGARPRYSGERATTDDESNDSDDIRRVGCGNCGAKLLLLPATIAAAATSKRLPHLREALGSLRDEDGFRYTLANHADHFLCPNCNDDQYAGRQERR